MYVMCLCACVMYVYKQIEKEQQTCMNVYVIVGVHMYSRMNIYLLRNLVICNVYVC